MKKLTLNQLRNILSEEIENLSYKPGKDITDTIISHDHPSEVESYENSWAGGQNLHYNIDHQETFGSKEKTTRGIERLRIVQEMRHDPESMMVDDLDPDADIEFISDVMMAGLEEKFGLTGNTYKAYHSLLNRLLRRNSDEYVIDELIEIFRSVEDMSVESDMPMFEPEQIMEPEPEQIMEPEPALMLPEPKSMPLDVPPDTVTEGLSRGALYRKRYYGRY